MDAEKVEIKPNTKLELPPPSMEGLQEVIAAAAQKKKRMQELHGDSLGGPEDPNVRARIFRLATETELITWVLNKVFPTTSIRYMEWHSRIRAEMDGPLGLHMTYEDMMAALVAEAHPERVAADGEDSLAEAEPAGEAALAETE